jgi:type II secretory pathway pseudopilin PulG
MNKRFITQIIEVEESAGQRGTATITAVLVLALLSVFAAASMSRVTTGQKIMNNDFENSKAFYAAQASLEQMTRNFDNIFTYHLYPTTDDIGTVQNNKPSISGFNFSQLVTQSTAASTSYLIQSGPYAGLTSLRDTWTLDATASAYDEPSVHLTREFYNHKVPIFQFGIFYNRDLAVHPGPQMWFSGRVHSNANLFVMSGNSVLFTNRVTAVGEIIRDWNRNGATLSQGGWTGHVYVNDPSGKQQELLPANGSTYYASAMTENLTTTSGPSGNPDPGFSANNDVHYTAWNNNAKIFGGNLQAHVPPLLLPIQIGLGKDPIELIKRGIDSGDYQASALKQSTDDPIMRLSRYCNKPGIRISLSDSQAELPGGAGGVRLDGDSTGTNAADTDADGSRGFKPAGMVAAGAVPAYQATRVNGFRLFTGASYQDNGSAGTPVPNNLPAKRQTWIKVEIVSVGTDQTVTTTDITSDFLSLGMTAPASDLVDAGGNPIGDSRAILKMQRYEIPGEPVRVADVNANDGSSPNTMTTAQVSTLSTFSGLSPTTANYVFSPGSGQAIAIGPYNVFTYQTASGSVGAFNYVSMTNNNYTPSMTGDPTSTTLNGYSLFTNLHSNPNGTLNYFTSPSTQLSNTLGNNIWGNLALAPGTTTTLPVTVAGFTSAPAYPSTYVMSSSLVPPSWKISFSGTSGKTFKLTWGGVTTASAITWTASLTAATVQTALAGLSSIGTGNVLVTGPAGGPFVVYLSNPAKWQAGGLTASSVQAGLTVTFADQPSSTWSSASSIEATAMGVTATIKAATNRTETVVPFPIEVFNPREGVYSADMTATGSPSWNGLYANGTNDKSQNGGTVPAWSGADLPAVGVMSVLDIDVANLKTFLGGAYDGCFKNGLKSSQIPTNPGWIVYVSDRRGDRDDDGEYDMEDIYGPIDGVLQPGEDANGNGVLDVDTTWEAATYSSGVPADIAAFFDHQYFRRTVRLINGGQLPGDNKDGFTLASENPVYILGNYNSDGLVAGTEPGSGSPPTSPANYVPSDTNASSKTPKSIQVPASISADAVWILSNAWKDGNSFRNPLGMTYRVATETTVRAAFFTGSTQGSITATPNQGGGDACLDGGVHNFPRFLENWGGVYCNYCGSLINPFYSRQGLGAHKSGNAGVYSPPNRNWTFDTSFLDITRVPPGTPLFQFVQTTGFRETTRQES